MSAPLPLAFLPGKFMSDTERVAMLESIEKLYDENKQMLVILRERNELRDENAKLRSEHGLMRVNSCNLDDENARLRSRNVAFEFTIARRDERIATLLSERARDSAISSAHSRAPVSQDPLKWSEFLATKAPIEAPPTMLPLTMLTPLGYVTTAGLGAA